MRYCSVGSVLPMRSFCRGRSRRRFVTALSRLRPLGVEGLESQREGVGSVGEKSHRGYVPLSSSFRLSVSLFIAPPPSSIPSLSLPPSSGRESIDQNARSPLMEMRRHPFCRRVRAMIVNKSEQLSRRSSCQPPLLHPFIKFYRQFLRKT
jgi:hypothetical protein